MQHAPHHPGGCGSAKASNISTSATESRATAGKSVHFVAFTLYLSSPANVPKVGPKSDQPFPTLRFLTSPHCFSRVPARVFDYMECTAGSGGNKHSPCAHTHTRSNAARMVCPFPVHRFCTILHEINTVGPTFVLLARLSAAPVRGQCVPCL